MECSNLPIAILGFNVPLHTLQVISETTWTVSEQQREAIALILFSCILSGQSSILSTSYPTITTVVATCKSYLDFEVGVASSDLEKRLKD